MFKGKFEFIYRKTPDLVCQSGGYTDTINIDPVLAASGDIEFTIDTWAQQYLQIIKNGSNYSIVYDLYNNGIKPNETYKLLATNFGIGREYKTVVFRKHNEPIDCIDYEVDLSLVENNSMPIIILPNPNIKLYDPQGTKILDWRPNIWETKYYL